MTSAVASSDLTVDTQIRGEDEIAEIAQPSGVGEAGACPRRCARGPARQPETDSSNP